MVRRNVAIRKHLQEAIQKEEQMALPNITDTLKQGQVEPEQESTSNHTKRDFIGYDCSAPVDIVAMKIDPEVDVCKNTPEPKQQREAQFKLLQETSRTRIKVKVCVVEVTLIPYYCGMHSHITLVPAFLELSEPAIVTPRMCEKLHEELSWTDHRGKKHDLLPDTTTSIYYNRVGHSTWNANLDCKGETYYHKGKVYPKMVITSNRKIKKQNLLEIKL